MANVQNKVKGYGQGHMLKNLWYCQKGLVVSNTHA